ncbi:YceI family protein [Pedobacter insulae]|uniref:Polyisoprenoid-binding protein YceI n=1 Tax=Pedobacter insulae TaxID=414048 RepID=A0A1I2XD51_9SPHI|nr:YceI family protein [Pedobacter insulae]SFH11322.1 Polyisoprenoid-binding protein YceI [Pedobacter insulae]
MKKLILFIIALNISVAAYAQTKWTVDPMHTFVNFAVKHSGISFVDGTFKKFEGTITSNKTDFTDSHISFAADVESISTNVEMRDKHLKSDDFFNAEQYPKMTFESTSFKKKRDNVYVLTGNLTIRDVTKEVRFNVVYGGTVTDPKGNSKAGFLATTKINRLDYHINYDPTGAGIAKDVHITLNLQFAKDK